MKLAFFTDAGHGLGNIGTHDVVKVVRDDGSVVWRPDPDGLIEKHVTLDIDDRLHRMLGDSAPFAVGRSRSFDCEMSQEQRGRASAKFGALFVASIHVNDNPDARVGGAQLYVGRGNKRSFRLATQFASVIARPFGRCQVIEAWDDPTTTADDWIENPLSIINAHIADVVLFEFGFRRNEADRKVLMSELGREEIASILRWCLVRAAAEYGS